MMGLLYNIKWVLEPGCFAILLIISMLLPAIAVDGSAMGMYIMGFPFTMVP